MQKKLMDKRIWQIINLIGLSIFIYQYTQWEQGLWIVISVVAIIGPFHAGLTYNKAIQRILGSLAGLLISMVVMSTLRYVPELLPLLGIVLAWVIAFAMAQQYKYFIMMITVIICINYAYLNIPFWHYDITHFVATRGMGILTGVMIYFCFEWFINVRNSSERIAVYQLRCYRLKLHQILKKLTQAQGDPIECFKVCHAQQTALFALLMECEKYQVAVSHQAAQNKRFMRNIRQLCRLIKVSLFYAQQASMLEKRIKMQWICRRLDKLVDSWDCTPKQV